MDILQICQKITEVVETYVKKYNLKIVERGRDSVYPVIPCIQAQSDTMSVELRSFWGKPELDISLYTNSSSSLFVLRFALNAATNSYEVEEFRVDGFPYEENISLLMGIVKFIKGDLKQVPLLNK